MKRLIAISSLLGWVLPASGTEELSGPLTVLPLYESEEIGPLAWAAQTMNERLQSLGGVDILGVDHLMKMLSGGERSDAEPVSVERIRGLFQQGYLQSYSFEYQKALEIFERILAGLDHMPFGEERWQLWVKTKIFQGICLMGLEREQEAIISFSSVLRTRPDYSLDRREFSPGTIELWNRARKELERQPKGILLVESEPPGAEVYLDGVKVGSTPLQGQWPQGVYHLYVLHPQYASAARRIEITDQPARVRLQMAFEGALVLNAAYPGVKAPKGVPFPQHWWPWLGERLGLKKLIVLMRRPHSEGVMLGGALMDLERGSRLREGWLELPAELPDRVRAALDELVAFLVTGRTSPSLQITSPEKPRIKETSLKQTAVRPAKHKFGNWALGAGGALSVAIVAHLLAEYYQDRIDDYVTRAGQEKMRENYHAWLGVGIAMDVTAAGLLVTGIIMHTRYVAPEEKSISWMLPEVVPGGVLLSWGTTF